MKKSCSQVASLAARVKAMYLASADDSTTINCHFEHQLTGPLFSINIKPEVDFQLSLLLVQSQSKYPTTQSFSSPS